MCWWSSEKVVTEERRAFRQGFLITYIRWMHGCTVYTLPLLILWISTHTNTHLLKGIPIFFFYFVPDAHMIICRHVSTCTHPQTHIPTTLLAMYHGGLPCCLSNQRMGSFQLHWSEHIIPFPSSPLLNTQIPHPPHTHARTRAVFLLTHQEKLCSPQ